MSQTATTDKFQTRDEIVSFIEQQTQSAVERATRECLMSPARGGSISSCARTPISWASVSISSRIDVPRPEAML